MSWMANNDKLFFREFYNASSAKIVYRNLADTMVPTPTNEFAEASFAEYGYSDWRKHPEDKMKYGVLLQPE